MEARRDDFLIRKEVVHCPLSPCSRTINPENLLWALFQIPDLLEMDWGALKRLPARLNIYKVTRGVICYTPSLQPATQVWYLF